MTQFFRDQDLKETYDNQIQIIDTLKQSQNDIKRLIEQSRIARKSVEVEFESAQQNILRMFEDLKAIHVNLKKYRDLESTIKNIDQVEKSQL
ncbi:hypothetical protein pb186bvf_014931 [Paramecium bursaria]